MSRGALITGAARGIGRGIALELACLGFDLVINYRTQEEAARATAAECIAAAQHAGHSIRAEICAADISHEKDRLDLIAFAREKFRRIDLLVNNAGMAPRQRLDILETTEASFDELMSVNLKGPYFLTQLAARWMLELKSRSGTKYRPKIITISSVSAYAPSVSRGEYCISKAGLSMMTALFASRLAEAGINVYEIRPGVIETDMTSAVKSKYDNLIEKGLTPLKRWGRPEDVARAVAAIAGDLLPFSTGEVINVDGGFHLRRL